MKIAVVGRTNVGKSTLINRFIQKKLAITSDEKGTTRDISYYTTFWNGKKLEFIDSAGFMPYPEHLDKITMLALKFAIENSEIVLFVVDGQISWSDDDKKLAKLIKNVRKKTIFIANKIDNFDSIPDYVYKFGKLGMGEPFLVSGLHGKNIGELLDLITSSSPSPSSPSPTSPSPSSPSPTSTSLSPNSENNIKNDSENYSKNENFANQIPKVALIGRPNVGKSSLLNKLLKKDRVVVHDLTGTTRDSISEIVQIGNNQYEIIDTAGIKKKLYKVQGADFYANIRTNQVIRFADICILLIDSNDISVQDIKLTNQIIKNGKGIIFAFNKYDLLDEYTKRLFIEKTQTDLAVFSWIPAIKMSASTGKNIKKLEVFLENMKKNIENRIATADVNKFIRQIILQHPPLHIKGKITKINYASQVSTKPTIFTLWCNNRIDSNYQKYIINQLRKNFNFEGVPIQINIKIKQ